MEKSKYLYTLKALLWGSSAARPELYRSNSTLLKYITSSRKGDWANDCIVIHHKCPVLLNAAAYEVANVKMIGRDSFLRTCAASFELRDYSITYKSNEYYIELDCQIWSQMERRLVPECIKRILQTKNIAGTSHLILLHNIDCLSASSLQFLRSVINDNIDHAKFVCTLRTHKRIFGTNALILHADFNIDAIVRELLVTTRPELVNASSELARTFAQDLSQLIATLHAPKALTYLPHIESYMHEQMALLLSTEPDAVYQQVTRLVYDLMSSFVNVEQVWPYILDFVRNSGNRQYDVVQILSDAQMEIARSNKIVFAYEGMFMRLHQQLRRS